MRGTRAGKVPAHTLALLLWLRFGFLLLWCGHLPLLAGRRNDALDPHVGNEVSVVLHIVTDVDTQHGNFRYIVSEKLHGLGSCGVGHGIVNLVAICESVFECRDEIGFRRFGLLDFQVRIFLARSRGAEKILGVGEMSDDLSISAYRIDGLEAVILLGHFFGGTEQDSPCSFIAALVDGAEGIVGGLLFLRKGGQGKKTQQNYGQKFSHGFSFSIGMQG